LTTLTDEQRQALVAHDGGLVVSAEHVLACSDFVRDSLARDASLLGDLLASGALRSTLAEQLCVPDGLPWSDDFAEADAQRWLRRWRRREMVRIAWRDLARLATLEQTLEDLTLLADRAVDFAHALAWRVTTERYGTPRMPDGAPMPLVVLGMGKLGGRELNYSSDIDLVFLFPEYGETEHAAPVSHEEFFLRLGQTLIRLLAAPTVDGIVFRVDMRLRPFGDSGALACGFSAFEDYLAQHGRDWERYAYVKARALRGAAAFEQLYRDVLRPFVYRRYLDFGVFESLREMKQLIEKQVARREMADHVKLGPGGIREIEFIVQAFQLIRGGQDRRLQTPRIFEALPLLAGGRLLTQTAVLELKAAYRHLRTLENRIQMLRDEQTHQLPTEPRQREQLVRAMRVADWDALVADLDRHRDTVQRHFRALVFGPQGAGELEAVAKSGGNGAAAVAAPAEAGLAALPLWDDTLDARALAALLEAAGVSEAGAVAQLLVDFRSSGLVRRLDSAALARLQRLLPALLGALHADDDHLVLLRRILRVLEAIGARSAYFALLNETPLARRRFVDVCRTGEFLAQQIAAHPLLLDELLDERQMAAPPSRAELAAEIVDRLERVGLDDPERAVEALSQFKRAAVFRVAIADLYGHLPLMRVSDRLTDIAELIVEQALRLGWLQMAAQYGTPTCIEAGVTREVRICAVGYGKLGGIELGYASDLDLVFLHDSRGESQQTSGERPIDNQVFFVRLAQRILHILTVHSAAGRLYEVDVRLRPSGKGGMLITGIDAFADYQRTEAWTWEHQALLHARSVGGSAELRAAFEQLRLELVMQAVRRDTLRDEVRAMRERMRRELSKARAGQWDMKQDPGGIADIEFLAQYWALRWAAEYPPVAMFSDTIRQLESVASADLVSQQTVDVLTAAYRAYRERGHHRSLRDETPVIGADEFQAERSAVTAIWDASFAADV
jgi:[glutamine synthetase] adenylyltransferase / [glutamine synthetase]-adenylyl-L-tyrosine phosphorylase